MKSIVLFSLFLLVGIANSRPVEKPPSYFLKEKGVVPHFVAPAMDFSKIVAANKAAELVGEAPSFAVPLKVNLTPATSGKWQSLSPERLMWRLKVSSRGAKSINLAFGEFYLPPSAKLFIYSPDYKQVRGAFTAQDNNPKRQLWTPIVFGKESILEVVVDQVEKSDLRLSLTSINHDYRGFGKKSGEKSGSCNVDVSCDVKEGWESQIKSVAVISTGGSRFCSGFLVNNTARDKRPLFMTAHHCGIDVNAAPSLVAYWNYENTKCRGTDTSGLNGDGDLSQFSTGATHLAGDSQSDFTIVEFNNPIDPEIAVYYAGWSASTDDPVGVTAIHHPNMEEKRISFDHDATSTTGYMSMDFGPGTHIRVDDWDLGTTEPGSSGSPLFDSNGRVVGQLHGGGAACGNDLSDWYGRISKSWELGLKEVLDPAGTGEIAIDGIGFELEYYIKANPLKIVGIEANESVDLGTHFVVETTLKNGGKKPISDLSYHLISHTDGIVVKNPVAKNIHLQPGETIDLKFQVFVAKFFQCGEKISFDLGYSYQEKTNTLQASVQTGQPKFWMQSSAPNLDIPDNDHTGVSDTITFEGTAGEVMFPGFALSLDILHSYVGDLTVTLTSPEGLTLKLRDQNTSESSGNIIGTFPTTLAAPEGFTSLDGQDLDGTWSLSVSDGAQADVGTLRSWSIRQLQGYVCE